MEEHLYLPAITMDTPLEYLIPTTSSAGVCTTSLVDYLTLTHNNFIEKCRDFMVGGDERSAMNRAIVWYMDFHAIDY